MDLGRSLACAIVQRNGDPSLRQDVRRGLTLLKIFDLICGWGVIQVGIYPAGTLTGRRSYGSPTGRGSMVVRSFMAGILSCSLPLNDNRGRLYSPFSDRRHGK